jgi:hypothetical protein
MKKILFNLFFIAITLSASATIINLSPNNSLTELETAIESATEGDEIVLADGTYGNNTNANVTADVKVGLTIKAANEGQATVNGLVLTIGKALADISGLTVDGVKFYYDGLTDSRYFLTVTTTGKGVTDLTLKNCYFYGYTRGVVRGTTASVSMRNLEVDNCIFEYISSVDASYAVINPQKCDLTSVLIKNSTFYNCPAAVFRNSESTTTYTFEMDNCTVLGCFGTTGSKTAGNAIALSNITSASVTDCIFSGSYDATPLNKPIDLKSASLGTIDNCLLEGFSTTLSANATVTNPVAATITSHDYSTLALEMSPLVTGIGDPRWAASATAINPATAAKAVQSVEYYNLLGVKVSESAKGLKIAKATYTDGQVNTSKVVK